MPIETPALLPCPQSSQISPTERRLSSDPAADAPVSFRTIELDERQVQSLQWMLNAEQAAVFRTWWTDTLVFGGAWWAAPATWPALEGQVVKVRRFIEAPQWSYAGVGFWRVSANVEVRGETLLPQTAAPPDGPVGWNEETHLGGWLVTDGGYVAESILA